MDDLVKQLRSGLDNSDGGEMGGVVLTMNEAAARIEALEQDLKAVLRREEDANRAAMKHLRALEQERIKSKNYADFNHEWRRRCEALERQVKAADALAEWFDLWLESGDTPEESDPNHLMAAILALKSYRATKEGGA